MGHFCGTLNYRQSNVTKNIRIGEPMDEKHEKETVVAEGTSAPDTMSCQEALLKTEERIKYLYADFENFRRNTEKERRVWAQSAQARVFTDLLVVVDDLYRACKELSNASLTDAERVRFQGFMLIQKELEKMLIRYGITEIPANIPFDPEQHEALVQVDSAGHESGQIVEVFEKGYLFKEMVLRPAKVSVAR